MHLCWPLAVQVKTQFFLQVQILSMQFRHANPWKTMQSFVAVNGNWTIWVQRTWINSRQASGNTSSTKNIKANLRRKALMNVTMAKRSPCVTSEWRLSQGCWTKKCESQKVHVGCGVHGEKFKYKYVSWNSGAPAFSIQICLVESSPLPKPQDDPDVCCQRIITVLFEWMSRIAVADPAIHVKHPLLNPSLVQNFQMAIYASVSP